MKIGIVVHGPGIVDSGQAQRIMKILSNHGDIKARLGGTMGRTAVIDAHLEDSVDITRKLLPSQSIRTFIDEGMDVIFLLNYGKSSITGHAFGYKVQKKCDNPPLIQIERPGELDGTVVSWMSELYEFANIIAKELNLKLLTGDQIKDEIKGLTGIIKDDSVMHRKIAGVSPGENIFINGIVVGRSKASEVTLVAQDGIIINIKGGVLKKHGLEKLGRIDIDKSVVKTGLLRKAVVKPRIIRKNKKIQPAKERKSKYKVAYLSHAAEDIYKLKDTDLVVTVGDDTTLVAADILYRFNVPIIGITDGDLDKVVEKGFKNNKSIIVELESGWDDIVGEKIFLECFKGKETIKIENIENFKSELLQIISKTGKVFTIIH
jgi:hypothetical protein